MPGAETLPLGRLAPRHLRGAHRHPGGTRCLTCDLAGYCGCLEVAGLPELAQPGAPSPSPMVMQRSCSTPSTMIGERTVRSEGTHGTFWRNAPYVLVELCMCSLGYVYCFARIGL